MKTKVEQSMVDVLAHELGCEYVSDLHFLTKTQKLKALKFIEDTEVTNASLFEWNDTLQYLFKYPKQDTAENAKKRLISLLSK